MKFVANDKICIWQFALEVDPFQSDWIEAFFLMHGIAFLLIQVLNLLLFLELKSEETGLKGPCGCLFQYRPVMTSVGTLYTGPYIAGALIPGVRLYSPSIVVECFLLSHCC